MIGASESMVPALQEIPSFLITALRPPHQSFSRVCKSGRIISIEWVTTYVLLNLVHKAFFGRHEPKRADSKEIFGGGAMKVVGLVFAVMLVPAVLLAAGVDNRCPKGYVWSDGQKRCVTAPPEAKEGACTKSTKPWMFNCSTSDKPVSIDMLYRSGYHIDRYANGFFFVKKRGSAEQECVTPKSVKAGPAAAATEAPAPAK
ncbi:MAG TPA: hypothetical protein DCR97_14835 [Deltaproteobacteria bacterium]|jgi:hypothetical protein|nr:hypothetical protein [Deltaproteobacteria bacterium]